MATVAELIVRARAETRDVERGFASMARSTAALADGLARAGGMMTAAFTLPLAAASVAIFDATSKMDSLTRGLEAVAGSASGAQQQLARLTVIARAPGIGFAEAIQGSVRLQSVGFSASLAERSLKTFANAIALTGGGRAELERVTVQLGQLASKGKVLTQDLRPIIGAAPAVGRALRSAFGTINAEDIEKLNLSTEQFLTMLLDQMEKLPQVTGGLGNAFENLKDSIFRTFAAIGQDQSSGLAQLLNSMAERVEALGKSFSSLSPNAQKAVLVLAAMTAAAGPLLIAISSLIRAYQTLVAVSLVSSTMQSTRAFIALIPAVRSARDAMVLAGIAGRGLVAAMMGPLGIAVAIGVAAAAWLNFRNKTREAVREAEAAAGKIAEALAGVDDATAKMMLTQKNVATAALGRSLEQTRDEIARTLTAIREYGGADPNKPENAPLRALMVQLAQQREALRLGERLMATRVAEIKVLADDVNARVRAAATTENNFGSPVPDVDVGDEDRLKALREHVNALAEAVALRLDDTRYISAAIALERQLTQQAGEANRTLQERAELLSLSNSLAEAMRGRLSGTEVKDAVQGNSSAAQVQFMQRALAEISRQTGVVKSDFERTSLMAGVVARNIERAAKDMRSLEDAADSLRTLAGVFAQFGRIGEEIADTLDRAAGVVEAMRSLRESQARTGESGIFSNLSNLLGGLGVAGAAVGLLGSMFGSNNQDELERARRQQENTEALERLRASVDRMSGTANEASRAQRAIGRLAEAEAAIRSLGFSGGREAQLSYVNRLIADLGISFADLNRIAQDLGIDLIKDNGKIATDALDDLASALGYHTDLITKLSSDLEGFRRVQDAASRLYNLEDTPQAALNDALAEIREFAPSLFQQLFAGLDTSGAGGREALQKALQTLFERMRSTDGLTLEDLGRYQDVNQLLDSLLRADSALDRFSESLNQTSLNVPQGFKAALSRFYAISGEATPPTNPYAAGVYPAAKGGDGASLPALSIAPGGVTISIQTGGDGRETYAAFYDDVQARAGVYPPMRAFAAMLAPPS